MNTSKLMARDNSDFCLTVDFKKKSDNPARVFKAMTDLITAFQKFDTHLIGGIDSQLEPVILLEDVEIGSLKTWLSSVIRGLPDEALKDADWKRLIGHYLVKAKYIVLNNLENKLELTDGKVIEDIRFELVEEAKKTDVKQFPHYEPIPIPKLIKSIDEINKSLKHLDKDDKVTFESKLTKNASFNMSLDFSSETMENLMTKEQLSNESTMILKVKKPDYLGNSMWEFKHGNKTIPAKITHDDWVLKFQKRQVDLRPGDSIKARVNVIVKYGHDNNLIGTVYEITEVIKELPLSDDGQSIMFDQ